MHSEAAASVTDSSSLRQRLMAPDPMQRAIGLHALEVVVERRASGHRDGLSNEASKFASRGIPYYSPSDPHFNDWVGKAVWYWERLHAA
jgi:hypothetical protein